MTLWTLARGSLGNRRATVALTVATIAISIALLVLVEQLRVQVREGFYRSVSGTDLIVGAPTSSVQLLLFSVFGLGDPTSNVSWSRYQDISGRPGVRWSIPLALGDMHAGYRVVGTTIDMFEHYRYAGGQPLAFGQGEAFARPDHVVLGARVARALDYSLDDKIVLAHGGGNVSLHTHDEMPFTVSGILAPTGTPVDQSLYVRLDAHHALHEDMNRGRPRPTSFGAGPPAGSTPAQETPPVGNPEDGADHEHLAAAGHEHDGHQHDEHAHDEHEHDHSRHDHDEHAAGGEGAAQEHGHDHAAHDEHQHDDNEHDRHAHDDGGAPDEISAFLLGLNTRAAALGMQYELNQEKNEPVLAILPGLALQQLWRVTGLAEQILRVVALLVVAAGLMGMLTALLTSLNERRREMAILRACGARPWQISSLLLLEAAAVTLAGIVTGLLLAAGSGQALAPWLLERFGITLAWNWPPASHWLVLGGIWVAGVLVALVPAAMVYRRTLADGMQVKL